MLSRRVIPALVFHLLVREMTALVLPNRLRPKRELSWLDQDLLLRHPVDMWQGDLSPGDEGNIPWDPEGHRTGTFLSHVEHPSNPCPDPDNNHRKINEKRIKLAPMDSIGSSLMSRHRNRKDEPSAYWQAFSE